MPDGTSSFEGLASGHQRRGRSDQPERRAIGQDMGAGPGGRQFLHQHPHPRRIRQGDPRPRPRSSGPATIQGGARRPGATLRRPGAWCQRPGRAGLGADVGRDQAGKRPSAAGGRHDAGGNRDRARPLPRDTQHQGRERDRRRAVRSMDRRSGTIPADGSRTTSRAVIVTDAGAAARADEDWTIAHWREDAEALERRAATA